MKPSLLVMTSLFSVLLLCFLLLAAQPVSAFQSLPWSARRWSEHVTHNSQERLVHRYYYKPRASLLSLASSSTPNDGKENETTDEDETNTKKLQGRKKRVIAGYQATAVAHSAVAAFVVVTTQRSPLLLLLAVVAAQVALPTGVACILVHAAQNNRLSSDTYKRFNLALLAHGMVGVFAVARMSSPRGIHNLLFLPFVLSVINAIKGYTYGVLGWDKNTSNNTETTSVLRDFVHGIKSTLQGLVAVPQNTKAWVYWVMTIVVMTLPVIQWTDMLRGSSTLRFPWTACRLGWLATVLYTLKDAADRNRLTGTTFVQLNYLAAFAMAASSALAGGEGQFLFWTSRTGRLYAAAAAFCAGNGLASELERRSKEG